MANSAGAGRGPLRLGSLCILEVQWLDGAGDVRDLALHLEDGGQGRDRGRAPLDLGGEPGQTGRVAVPAAALVTDHLTVAQLDHASLHLVDEAGLVCGHDHGRAAGVDPREQLHDVDGRAGIQVSGRLIGEQHLRTVHQRASDRHALLLATGQLVGKPLLLAVETHEREHLGHRLLDEAARGAGDLQCEGDVLMDGLVGQETEVLKHRNRCADGSTAPSGSTACADRARGRRPFPRSASPPAG